MLPSLCNPIHSLLSNCKPIFCLIEITKSRFAVEAIVPYFKGFRREHLASLNNRELIYLLIDAIGNRRWKGDKAKTVAQARVGLPCDQDCSFHQLSPPIPRLDSVFLLRLSCGEGLRTK
ncbi:hypothetical protein PGT21_014933 [Puccinia graminis f. sp. tritici]|nr:hypothetical protein PGT21_028255 [Puccinia graminis f. sp. tritici]KAA1096387.1 hypothetical protein PGT21_014933 [Puccinia graminis f. sp. tritici]